ncbi:alpha-parvin isoform X1 [Podarcis lilfordi]|uniref:Alpha-parvin isoform X1 n=1 Tax=Podarcis lilfordi TaxID=74358 RepID=A0AA35JNU5_9SAUR|nr:alpha-parvin isoform X1 [Podarcis lilfordi]
MATSPQKSPSSPKSPTPKSPPSRKKDDSFLGKLGGTLARRKKAKEVSELQEEGINAINLPLSPIPFELDPEDTMLEENEVRTMIDPNSRSDPKLQELMKVLIDWINDVLVGERIIVKDLAEDLYDGQVLQKLFEKLESEKLNVAEVTQSEIAQKQKLQTVLEKINETLKLPPRSIKWNVDSVHAKSLVAILHLLVALSQYFRAPIRLPDHVSIQVVVVQKREGILQSRQIQEEITGNTEALSGRHERDAFDTLFDHAPDKLNVVKKTLITFVNKHLNKLNLEVTELETQFADGVYLVLLMGLLEGYFVPLHSFFLTPDSFEQKVLNVSFAFELMQDGGLEKPKPRPEDIVNCDLKSTLRKSLGIPQVAKVRQLYTEEVVIFGGCICCCCKELGSRLQGTLYHINQKSCSVVQHTSAGGVCKGGEWSGELLLPLLANCTFKWKIFRSQQKHCIQKRQSRSSNKTRILSLENFLSIYSLKASRLRLGEPSHHH